jgi:hypothetical protein
MNKTYTIIDHKLNDSSLVINGTFSYTGGEKESVNNLNLTQYVNYCTARRFK